MIMTSLTSEEYCLNWIRSKIQGVRGVHRSIGYHYSFAEICSLERCISFFWE